jgi:site-specific DNA recombinase
MEKLVVEALLDQLLQPERVTAILTTLKAARDGRQASADRRLVDLARQVSDAGERLSRLYASIEAGTIDGTDPALRERVAALKATRDRAAEALDYARKSSALPIEINPMAIDRFTAGRVTKRKRLGRKVRRANSLLNGYATSVRPPDCGLLKTCCGSTPAS